MAEGQPSLAGQWIDWRLLSSLENILEGVVRTPEIAEELEAARIPPYEIVHEIVNDPFFLSRARGRYKSVVDRTEEILQHEKGKPDWSLSAWYPTRREILFLAGAVAWPVLFVLAVFAFWMPSWLIVHGIVLMLMYFFDPLTRAMVKRGLPDDLWKRLSWGRQRRILKLGIPFLHYEWKQSIRDEVVLPEVRAKINQKREPDFDHTLSIRDASGLRSADDMSFVILTTSAEKFLREFNRLDTGAIALAGMRGSGKSTLIRALAEDMVPRAESRPRMTITAAAPGPRRHVTSRGTSCSISMPWYAARFSVDLSSTARPRAPGRPMSDGQCSAAAADVVTYGRR